MLELDGVRAGYGGIEALKGISLKVAEGEIVTLIGGNGAGKTTTLMTISGVVKVRSGKIKFKGQDLRGMQPHAIVRLGIAQSPEGRPAAEASVEAALRLTSDDARLLRQAIDLQLQLGRADRAVELLNAFRRLQPADQLAQVQTIDLQVAAMQSADVAEVIGKALE